MVEQPRKDPGRKGRRADRGGKTRHSRPRAGRASSRPARGARTRRTRSHGMRTVIPSNRWRPMRRVGEAPPAHGDRQQEAPLVHGGPQGGLEQPSPSERPSAPEQASVDARQTEQAPPRHGRLGWLFRRER